MARSTLELKPVSPFRLDLTVWTLRRRPDNLVDRWDGTTYRRVLPLPGGPVEVAVAQSGPPEASRLRVAVAGQPNRAAVRAAVTSALERLLGLGTDLTEFYRFAAHDRRLGPLARRFRGVKPPRFATVFECAVTPAGQVVLDQTPVLIEDLRTDGRYPAPSMAHEHGVVSSLTVPSPCTARPGRSASWASTRPARGPSPRRTCTSSRRWRTWWRPRSSGTGTRNGCESGRWSEPSRWRPSGRWPPASRTSSETRSPRSRGWSR